MHLQGLLEGNAPRQRSAPQARAKAKAEAFQNKLGVLISGLTSVENRVTRVFLGLVFGVGLVASTPRNSTIVQMDRK